MSIWSHDSNRPIVAQVLSVDERSDENAPLKGTCGVMPPVVGAAICAINRIQAELTRATGEV